MLTNQLNEPLLFGGVRTEVQQFKYLIFKHQVVSLEHLIVSYIDSIQIFSNKCINLHSVNRSH